MTQTPDRRDGWHAPEATPDGGSTAPTADPDAPAREADAPACDGSASGDDRPTPGPDRRVAASDPVPVYPTAPAAAAAVVGPPAAVRRGSGRPGWTGVVAVGAGAALLSSLLTAGVLTATQDDVVRTSATTSSDVARGASAGPLVDGTSAAPDWNAVAAAVEPSVVSVRVAAPGGNGEGSGVVLDTRGRILTNNHVIAAAAGGGQITVVLFDGRTYAATIVGRDATTDLAVIAVTGPPSDLKPATLGDSSAVRVGDPVMAVGNPLGLSDTVTTGIVSALDRPVTTSARQEGAPGRTTRTDSVVTNAIQTDAAVNPGNSGGALVDAGGRVIGITSSIASLGSSAGGPSGSIGLGFAIPVNEAKDVAAQLQDGGTVSHAFLGVTLADGTATVDGTRRQAAVIGSVTGDAVVALDGRRLDGADSLVARIRALRPGTAVTLTVVRDGASREVEVTLGTRPAAG